MDKQTKILAAAVLAVGLVVVAILLRPAIEEGLAPELRTAWVAVEIADAGTAEVGVVEIAADTPFTLHAVVEARGRSGPVYYTEAQTLVLGGREVAPERLRRWDRPLEPRIRWFTVEGTPPYLELATADDLERFRFQELYRADWPLAWSVPGRVEPAQDDHLHGEARLELGTQRYRVAVELYDEIDKLRPKKQVRSRGAEDLRRAWERFPTVRRVLPGRLAPASRVFGLTQLEVEAGVSSRELLREIDALARQGLAFSRATVLRDQIRAAGKTFAELEWTDIDLVAGRSRWGATAHPGDLIRVGERVVVLYRDRGRPGELDYEDLSFDYARGAAVRPLGEVFTGTGVVELASLAP